MGSVLTWNGRHLSSNGNVQYIYDASGLRTVKYDSAQRTEYTYANGKLIYQETTFANGSTPVKLFFYYDSYGNLTGIKYNDAMFYAATNSQGDVIAIYHANGTVYARYEYDAWGNILSITDANGNAITSSTHIANVNPIRYRGYVYDTDTGLYYLQSRYYDPATGRFLNADGLIDNRGTTTHNMFAYCVNNPVGYTDESGFGPRWNQFISKVKSFFGIKDKNEGGAAGSGIISRMKKFTKSIDSAAKVAASGPEAIVQYSEIATNALSEYTKTGDIGDVPSSFSAYDYFNHSKSFDEHVQIIISEPTIYYLYEITNGEDWDSLSDKQKELACKTILCYDRVVYYDIMMYYQWEMSSSVAFGMYF